MKFRTYSFLVLFAVVFLALGFTNQAQAGVTLIGVTISSTEPDPTETVPIPIAFDFDESVSGFDISDITPTNGTLSNFSGFGANYTVDITPLAEGLVTVAIAEGAATGDVTAGNPDTEADSFSITYDLSPVPTVTFNIVKGVIVVTVDFGEDVTGFDASDVTVTNGTLANFAGMGAVYTFDVLNPTGKITVDIADAAAQDLAGNDSQAVMPMFTAPSVPDLRLGSSSRTSSHKGDNNYTKARLIQKKIKSTAKFFCSFENDGVAGDTFGASSRKQRKFKTTYVARGSGNITAALAAGRFTVNLRSGEIQFVKAKVKPKDGSSTKFKDAMRLFDTDSSASDSGLVLLTFEKEDPPKINPGAVGGSVNP